LTLPPLRAGTPAQEDLLARRARMPSAWTPEMLEPGTVARGVTIGGVSCLICEAETAADTILYFHGGGYRMGSAAAYANFGTRLAAATDCRIILVDYRLAPEHPFPAAIADALAVFEALVAEYGQPPIVAGDSAGGGLAAAVALTAKPKPRKAVLLSPWVDLTVTNPAFASRTADQFFPRESAAEAARQYLQGHDPEDPLASPLKGDLSAYPPTLILASADECLIGDALAFQTALTEDRRPVETHIVPGMIHVWPVIAPALPESAAALRAIRAFVQAG
jgi:acetyl esterase/lipase